MLELDALKAITYVGFLSEPIEFWTSSSGPSHAAIAREEFLLTRPSCSLERRDFKQTLGLYMVLPCSVNSGLSEPIGTRISSAPCN